MSGQKKTAKVRFRVFSSYMRRKEILEFNKCDFYPVTALLPVPSKAQAHPPPNAPQASVLVC